MGLALGGFLVLRRRRDVLLILAGPLLATLTAAVAQQYPFRMRLVLFLLPTLLLTAAATVQWIVDRTAARSNATGTAIVLLALLPPLVAIVTNPPPYTVGQFKPVLAYVQSHRRPGDSIYAVRPMEPVSAELFDLSDTARLRLATAGSFHAEPDTLHVLCFDWVSPTPNVDAVSR